MRVSGSTAAARRQQLQLSSRHVLWLCGTQKGLCPLPPAHLWQLEPRLGCVTVRPCKQEGAVAGTVLTQPDEALWVVACGRRFEG